LARAAAAAICWALAWHFKPVLIVGPLGAGAEHAFACAAAAKGDRPAAARPWLVAVAAFALLAVLSAVALQRASGNLWAAHALSAADSVRWSPYFIWESARNPDAIEFWLLPAMMAAALPCLVRYPIACAFFAQIAAELALMTKQGANINYLL